jgi:hypothetical protein
MDNLNEILDGKYRKSDYRLEADYQKQYDEDMMFRRIANGINLPKNIIIVD